MNEEIEKDLIQPRLLKIHFWWYFPSHHLNGLFEALIARGVDLKVTYYEPGVFSDRVALGWSDAAPTKHWESSLQELKISATQRLGELADYIQIIPGYDTSMLRSLSEIASRLNITWCHWSEPSYSGLRWWVRSPIKMLYARRVNKYALGAFAQGIMARLDFMRWGIRSDKIADLTYAVPSSKACSEPDKRILDFANGRGIFLFVGQLIRRKAIDVQIRAFAKLNTKSWCLVFVGAGNLEKYANLVANLGLSESILFLPPVRFDAIASIHKAGDVLLLPSRFDGWGVVANEAAENGKALILSTSCGAGWHLVKPGINGFLVEPGSVTSLTSALRHYVNNGRSLAVQHGNESKRVVQFYSCDASALRMIATLRSWLN